MTPSAAAATDVVIGPTMDVVHFSSALTYSSRNTGSQWLTASASRNIDLPLPDGTVLALSIKLSDSSGLQPNDFITINAWLTRRLIDANGDSTAKQEVQNTELSKPPMAGLLRADAFPLEMQCVPPQPRFKSSDDEPSDNSPGTRATRLAVAHLDTASMEEQWTTEEKVAFVWAQLYIIVSMLPAEEAVNVALPRTTTTRGLVEALLDSNLATPHPVPSRLNEPYRLICHRAAFWQSAYPFRHIPWLGALGVRAPPIDVQYAVPTLPSLAAGTASYHPRRPRKPSALDGPIYTRHILELGQTLTFEPISSEDTAFVKLFTKWQNEPRVVTGWRQPGTEAEQQRYLAQVEADTNTLGVVGKWNGEPWGYVELFWSRESNVGAYYDAGAYDRGFHALVGEQRFRGPHRVRSWMGSVVHMLFTSDPRTQRVILEPRASNHTMINYSTMCGGHVEKLIDLPHKRAALVVIPREGFFQLCPLGPLTKQA